MTHDSSAKHIETRMFWLKDEVEWGVMEPLHILSNDNLADCETKPLGDKAFWRLVDDICGKTLTPVGEKIRRGEVAYKSRKMGRPDLTRKPITLHMELPGPQMKEYFQDKGRRASGITDVGACE